MNADRLLAHYERVANAPDAIPRLRRFILNLAVRGKLVPQDTNDEPASELLKQITAEKARLVKLKSEGSGPLIDDGGLFQIPKSWSWVPATFPVDIVSDVGKKIQTKDVSGTGRFPVVDQGKVLIRGYYDDNSKVIRVSTPLIVFGDHTRETKLIDFDFVVGADGVKLLRPVRVSPRYYYYLLCWLPLDSRGYARHFKQLRASFVPLAPLAEQHRIVAKVDELLALCDRLEAARGEREGTRDKFTAASLARLNTPDPEAFRDDARFALDALPALTTRPDQIKQLRQIILNLAVRGKLVPQNPNDESASELLKRIAAEKARLVKAGEIKKAEPACDLSDSDPGLPTPRGWTITTLRSLCVSVTDGDHLPPPKAENGIPFLVIGNIRSQHIDFTGTRFVPPRYYEALDPIRRPKNRDLLYTLVGSYGIPVVVRDNRPFCVQRHIGILRPSKLIDVSFLARAMESTPVFDQATACATGIAQKTVPLSGLRSLLIHLPPLAEQRRIVAKVDELMALCDRLEASLSTGEHTRRRLLDALLAEALEPVERDLEQAAEADRMRSRDGRLEAQLECRLFDNGFGDAAVEEGHSRGGGGLTPRFCSA